MTHLVTITMSASVQGSSDGIRVTNFLAGETYEVSPELADVFAAHGFAVKADVQPAPASDEDTGDQNGDGEVDELEPMTVAQLKDLAALEEIDLGAFTKKADIIAAIVAGRAAKAAAAAGGDQNGDANA